MPDSQAGLRQPGCRQLIDRVRGPVQRHEHLPRHVVERRLHVFRRLVRRRAVQAVVTVGDLQRWIRSNVSRQNRTQRAPRLSLCQPFVLLKVLYQNYATFTTWVSPARRRRCSTMPGMSQIRDATGLPLRPRQRDRLFGTEHVGVKVRDPTPSARRHVEIAYFGLDLRRHTVPVELRVAMDDVGR